LVQGAITEPVVVQEGERFVCALPAEELTFTYGIDFPDYPAIGRQWLTWVPGREDFGMVIAPARTFGLADQIAQLQAQGLIQGGSLGNALVCDRERGWLNPPLRFADEPVRHKLLDFLGIWDCWGITPGAFFGV
jgi:UDP-3-O-[3-hydroxymyristoyl] N-acetylglucosamine deacetylase